jgi:hypothetical protein
MLRNTPENGNEYGLTLIKLLQEGSITPECFAYGIEYGYIPLDDITKLALQKPESNVVNYLLVVYLNKTQPRPSTVFQIEPEVLKILEANWDTGRNFLATLVRNNLNSNLTDGKHFLVSLRNCFEDSTKESPDEFAYHKEMILYAISKGWEPIYSEYASEYFKFKTQKIVF